jgi:signal transduction histidine kinase
LKKHNKEVATYIEELEGKIVDLSLRLKAKDKEHSSLVKGSNVIVGQLIHNLKNPVGVIYSFSEMIEVGGDSIGSEKLKKHINVINKSASFTLALLDSFSIYFNLYNSDVPFDLNVVNLTKLISEILDKFNVIASEKNVAVKTVFPKEKLLLKLDGSRMTLALSNIINNALRYSYDNSEISITIKEYQNRIEIEIADKGIGISEKDLAHIFDPFFVVNTYSEDKKKCIGLGLSIADKIIKRHGGEMIVTSDLGEGSKFRIILSKIE